MNLRHAFERGKTEIARAIGRAFLCAWPDPGEMVARAARTVGYPWTFLRALAERCAVTATPPPLAQVAASVANDPGFLGVWRGEPIEETDAAALEQGFRFHVLAVDLVPRRMRPVVAWPVPAIPTEADLLRFLELRDGELTHLAGLGRRERRHPPGPLRNHHYVWRAKPGGAQRLIEAPKQRLKKVQRRILREILDRVPPGDHAHGFRSGRSAASHAALHTGRHVVVRLDLAEFFPSISAARVTAVFHAIGYPERVARLLGALTTNAVPDDVLDTRRAELDPWLRALLAGRHLPQGAPSSPALANLCALHLDRRLAGLASAFGATYSRYADDLAFSGDATLARFHQRFIALATAIAADEGFRVNARKTRVMRAGVRQKVTGIVVNHHPNVERRDYERLKAILHNAARHGPASQNREGHPDFRAHLRGRIAHVALVNPARGRKLLAAFERVDWS